MQGKRLIIIGAGPGGYETALAAARRGVEVTLIEAAEAGGTCLNEGCIPTKALCRTASLLADIASAGTFGVAVQPGALDFPAAIARKNAVVAQLKSGVETLLSAPGIRYVKGRARFAGTLAVEVDGQRLEADDIIIATGSIPASLPIPGANLPGVVTSREMLESDKLPKRLAVVGGGVIGLEFASIFRAFGCEVTVVEYAKEVLPFFDSDMAKRLRQSLGKRGIAIETQSAVTSMEETPAGLRVNYSKKGKDLSVEADRVLMAVGRRPNVDSLNLSDAGISFTKKGIAVDSDMQTNVPHIYAVGDVTGQAMLAHAATAQGIRALNAITGESDRLRLDVMPAAVFTMPEVATVGLTEDACKERGIACECRKSFFRAVGKAVCVGETDGYCKLLYSPGDRKLLGCHIYGPHAADLVQEVCALMTVGGTIDDLRSAIHIHPSLGEIVQAAARS